MPARGARAVPLLVRDARVVPLRGSSSQQNIAYPRAAFGG